MSQNNGTASGRDERGRFTKGNSWGHGNPFARQTAQLRKAFVSMLTPQDMMDVAAAMLIKAKAGDVAAARLLSAYSIGRPGPAEDPDRLDANEWKVRQEQVVDREACSAFYKGTPVDVLNAVAEVLRGEKVREYCQDYLQGFKERDPEGYERYQRMKELERQAALATNGGDGEEEDAAPSANGGDGGPTQEVAPSANGGDGEGKEEVAPSANGDNGDDSRRRGAGTRAAGSGAVPSRNGANGDTCRHGAGTRPAGRVAGPSGNGDNGDGGGRVRGRGGKRERYPSVAGRGGVADSC